MSLSTRMDNGVGITTAQSLVENVLQLISLPEVYLRLQQVIDDPDRKGRKGIQIRLTRLGGALLTDGVTVTGTPAEDDLAAKIGKELESGIDFLKQKIEQIGRDVQAFPDSREYQDLKKSLEDLANELQRKEKEARERLKREWLPQLQQELDALRERLREKGREEQMAPLDQEMERIRRI